MKRTLKLFVAIAVAVAIPRTGNAFWVVNFGTANTLAPGRFGFAAGIGGQVVLVGNPQRTSAFFTIPHAGFRTGITSRLDCGLRLAPVPLPFALVGPGFGANLDVKYCFTEPGKKFAFAVVLGGGGAHVLIDDQTRLAYSPNTALLGTWHKNETVAYTVMLRHVTLAFPTAALGAKENSLNIFGISLGLKKEFRPHISVLPEVGAYWYDGKMVGVGKSGPGFQYGIMIATSF